MRGGGYVDVRDGKGELSPYLVAKSPNEAGVEEVVGCVGRVGCVGCVGAAGGCADWEEDFLLGKSRGAGNAPPDPYTVAILPNAAFSSRSCAVWAADFSRAAFFLLGVMSTGGGPARAPP